MLDIGKVHKTHNLDEIREMIGTAAVLYALAREALYRKDFGGFAGAFRQIRRIQDRVIELDLKFPDQSMDTRKGLRIMVETIQSMGLSAIPGTDWQDMASFYDIRFPAPVSAGAHTPDVSGIDPDVLRLLGDYLNWHSWCYTDRALIDMELRPSGKDESGQERLQRLAMAADRAALFIDSRDVLAAPTAVLLEHALDAGHTPEDDLGRKTYRQLSSEIAQMDADMKRICAEHGIKPHPLKQWEGAVQVGPSTDCATERMGRLLIAYADGMAAIEGRRRRTALFLAEFQEVVARASEIEPNGSAYQRYTMLAENKHADAGAAPLSASRVAHALLVEMRERGVAKFKKSPEELGGQFAGLSTVDVTLLEVPGSLKTLGLLAAEYVGLVYAAKDAPYHISRDLALDRVKTRLARTRDVAYGLVSELDMVHAPDDDPVSRTVNYVLRDASSVLTVMDKEIKKADRLAKRYRRRIA